MASTMQTDFKMDLQDRAKCAGQCANVSLHRAIKFSTGPGPTHCCTEPAFCCASQHIACTMPSYFCTGVSLWLHKALHNIGCMRCGRSVLQYGCIGPAITLHKTCHCEAYCVTGLVSTTTKMQVHSAARMQGQCS